MRFTHKRFTVSAGALIFNQEGEVLLLKHLFRIGSGWGIPGGFLETGEQPHEALRRELLEEVELKIDKVKIFAARTFHKAGQVEIVFVCRAGGEPKPSSVEVIEAAWFHPDSLPEGLPHDQKALIQRALRDGAKRCD